MKKYQIEVKGLKLEIVQDNDGKFVTPDIVKEYEKVGSAVKPSFEPIIVARKPFKGSLVDNVIEYGVGGINIDECRVRTSEQDYKQMIKKQESFVKSSKNNYDVNSYNIQYEIKPNERVNVDGRFPANTILTYDETDYDEVCGGFPYTKGDNRTSKQTYDKSIWGNAKSVESNCLYADSGSASRYFYCAKASKKDRDEGLDIEIEEYVLKEDTPKEIEQLILNSLTS